MTAAAMLMTSCADGDPAVYIVGGQVPTTTSDTCAYSGTFNADLFLTKGVYDVAYDAPYVFGGLVASQLRERSSELGVNKATLIVHGYDIEILDRLGNEVDLGVDSSGAAVNNPYRQLSTGLIQSVSSAGAISYGISAVDLIPSGYRTVLRSLIPNPNDPNSSTDILVKMTVFGETNGGLDVESREFQFPIEICSGCLEFCGSANSVCHAGQDGNTYCATQ
ncbi:MAG: hypothetical protein R3A47_10705 [Polyangiales bacterium]